MKAEVISIGDELTSGQRLDTNTQWLSERLGELGVHVAYHTTVGDDLDDHVRVLREAIDRADLIVSTGGLGPTADDLTREAMAMAVGAPLEEDASALAHIRALFARRQRPMPERNTVQAHFPRGSRVIPNPHGTAPGIDLDVARPGRRPARIFALPGVPAEMREMWQATVADAIATMEGGERRVICHRRIKCFGIGESDLEQMLPDLIRRGRYPLVGITVSQATITLRVTAEAETAEAAFLAMEPTLQTIRQCLGDLVFGEEEDELHDAVVRVLAERRQTLATIEWGTGGLIAHWLSGVDPDQSVFRGGTILRGHVALPGMEPLSDAAAEAEPEELARRMAASARESFATDFALAVGPFPAASTSGRADQVACAVATPTRLVEAAVPFSGHPDILLARTAKSALNLLRRAIRNEA